MSLGHMPRRYQQVFAGIWVLSAGVLVAMFATHPFDSTLSPIPFVVTLLLFALAIRAAWAQLHRSDANEQ
jgi:hypothetical protein